MKIHKIKLTTFFVSILSANFLFGNYAFKKKVKNICKSYRITVESDQFELENDTFYLTLESGRNNFEMFMVVGFAAAGQAVAHQKDLGLPNAYTPGNVQVTVRVPSSKDTFNTFVASCSSDLANELAQGKIDSSEFMQKITKNLKII